MSGKTVSLSGGAVLIAMIGLTGCGHTQFDRGMSGAMVGSATGATVGALTGISIAQGAVLGAAGGAIIGLVTDSSQINLGRPFWHKDASRALYKPASQPSGSVKQIQAELAARGYDPGPIDGIAGEKTRRAIRAYQRDHGLLVNGQPSNQLASHISSN